jgi:hypothetical protein
VSPATVLILVLMGAAGLFTAYGLVDGLRFRRRARRADGRVVAVEREVSGGDPDSAVHVVERPVVEYRPAGSSGVVRASMSRPLAPGRLPVDSHVTVLYDPADRGRILVEEVQGGELGRTLAWGVYLLVAGAALLSFARSCGL